jgi:Zn-dependent M16 (insulinase) family peptidase
MKDKVIHGFRFVSERALPELEATLREAVYEKNGAKLLFIDRKESNKTFSIAFKTIPTDDTGVFHILEHSVLGGSEKYPVKEPFVELLKGSMQTFLNAFTFPDKTMYPVCSRNSKDFLNLIEN